MIARSMVFLCVAAWFLTVTHTVVCHSENAMCGHSGCSESTVCLCPHHVAITSDYDSTPCANNPLPPAVLPLDETIYGLLLPCDIFRPPLTNG